jgi:hypothetical protein
MTALEEYNRERGNDLDEDPAFEQGRSYLRDYADAAIESLKIHGNCAEREYEVACMTYRCAVDGSPVNVDGHCHHHPSRWKGREA